MEKWEWPCLASCFNWSIISGVWIWALNSYESDLMKNLGIIWRLRRKKKILNCCFSSSVSEMFRDHWKWDWTSSWGRHLLHPHESRMPFKVMEKKNIYMQGISTVNYFKYLKPCKNINIHLKTHAVASSVQLFMINIIPELKVTVIPTVSVIQFPKESVSRSVESHFTFIMWNSSD